MPPRHAYWTILIDGQPTAFRASDRDELLPTLNRLKEKHPDTMMKWFERGRLWESREDARQTLGDGFQVWSGGKLMPPKRPRRESGSERRDQPTPGAPRETRDRGWRPGGQHRDPREKYATAKKAKWQRFKDKIRDRAFTSKPDDRARPRSDSPHDESRRPPEDGRREAPRRDAPRDDRPRDDRFRNDRPRENRPREGRPREDRPWNKAARDPRPREGGFRDSRPRGDRPPDERRGDPRPWDQRSRDDRRPRDERPPDQRFRDSRPRNDRPREDRPKWPGAHPERVRRFDKPTGPGSPGSKPRGDRHDDRRDDRRPPGGPGGKPSAARRPEWRRDDQRPKTGFRGKPRGAGGPRKPPKPRGGR